VIYCACCILHWTQYIGVGAPIEAFTRFRLYAKHIRHLDAFGELGRYYTVSGWQALMLHARRQTLLPNLASLTLHSSSDEHGPDQLMWAAAFASSSLVEFSIVPSVASSGSRISYLAASAVLKTITKRSPRIQKLGVFPSEELGGQMNDGGNYLLNFLSVSTWRSQPARAIWYSGMAELPKARRTWKVTHARKALYLPRLRKYS
jgi:hypothetical protein